MINTTKDIYNHIENAKIISRELTNILLEMDTTNSRVTQASLNDMLVTLYERIKKEDKLKFECNNAEMNCEEFIEWLEENITIYSVNMLKETVGLK